MRWLRRIRAAVGMGVVWALAWAVVAVLVGVAVDPDGSMDEMWHMVGALPGFLGGVTFSAVLGTVARRRRFEELSVRRFAAWGGAAGLLVGILPFTIGTSTSAVPLPLLAGTVVGSITLLAAASAAGSLALARRSAQQPLPGTLADGALGSGAARRSPARIRSRT